MRILRCQLCEGTIGMRLHELSAAFMVADNETSFCLTGTVIPRLLFIPRTNNPETKTNARYARQFLDDNKIYPFAHSPQIVDVVCGTCYNADMVRYQINSIRAHLTAYRKNISNEH